MPITPGITLTANLQSVLGGAALGGYLRITLCGFGPVLPCVAGTGMLADAAVPQVKGPQVGSTPLSQVLYGNDVITPASTFYEIALLDQNRNVIQSGMYQFANGPAGFPVEITKVTVITLAPPSVTAFVVLTPATPVTVVADARFSFSGFTNYVTLNGKTYTWEPNAVPPNFLQPGDVGFVDTGGGNTAGAYVDTGTMTALTTTVDLSQATQIVAPFGFALAGLSAQACSGAVPGNTYLSPGPIVALFYNGVLLPRGQAFPTLSYTAAGEVATLNFNTEPLDRIDALCIF